MMAFTPRATAASTCGWLVGGFCCWPFRARRSCFCSTVEPTLPADAKSLRRLTADS